MSSVAPRSGSVKGSVAPHRPEPAPAVPFPTWHALCAEMLARHREMGLNYGECCLFAILVHYSTPDENRIRFSHATNETLAEKMGCEIRDVQRFLKNLEAAGFIDRWKRTSRGGKHELDRSRQAIMILWEPGDDRMFPISFPWAPGHAEAKATQDARMRQYEEMEARNAPNVKNDVAEHPATSDSTLGYVKSVTRCNVNPVTTQRQVCRTYEIPSEIPLKERTQREPASPSSPASAGPNPKTPPAGTDAQGEGEQSEELGIPSGWSVMLPPKAAGELLRNITAKVERPPSVVITPDMNAAGIEWLKRWRKWRDGGKAGPFPEWTSSEPMLPGVRQRFDEHERRSKHAE